MNGENLRHLLRARLEEELAEARRYFGDSLDRPLVVGPQPPDGELPPGGAVVNPKAWPKELPLPLLAGQALARVGPEIEILVAAMAEELSSVARILVEPDLLEAVLSRPEVVRQWPGPEERALPERGTLDQVQGRLWATLLAWHHLCRARGALPEEGPVGLPSGVAPGPVARWAQERLDRYAGRLPAPQGQRIRELAAEMVQNAGSERGVRGLSWTGPDGRRLACPAAGMALLYQAEQEVREGLQRRTIALDAGKPHYDLLVGWRNLPKDPRHEMKRPQLSLPLEGEGIHPRGHHPRHEEAAGLRGAAPPGGPAAAVLPGGGTPGLGAVDAGRSPEGPGLPRSRLPGPPDPRPGGRPGGDAHPAGAVGLFARQHASRHRRPLLLVGGRFGRIEGAESRLEGLELQINPLLYEGVRDPETGELGSNWFPAPLELARIDHTKHPYALPLGLLLPIRWQWDPGAEHTEKGICRLYPAEWLLDRAIRGLLPQEFLPVNLPQTGAELRTWRKGQGWSQQRLAQELEVVRETIYRAEGQKKAPLSQTLQEALKRAQEQLPGPAPEKPKADPGWWK